MGTGPALERPMFVFTDERGSVILMEDDLARMLGFHAPEDVVGDPLAAALGMAPADAEGVLREIAATGSARHRPAEIWNRRTRRRMWVLLGGSAPAVARGFIGADITVSPIALAAPVEDLDHRSTLERMAAMVRHRMSNEDQPAISEEKELELRTYFAARLLALYVLIVRMAGRDVAHAFEERICGLSRERGWSIEMDGARVRFGVGPPPPEAWEDIDRLALEFAARVTTLRLVGQELAELDVNFGPATIQRAEGLGLRREP